MASQNIAFLALFLSLNLVFFSLVNGCPTCPKPRPPPKPKACPPPPTPSTPSPHKPTPPTPKIPTPSPKIPTPIPPTPTPPTPTPKIPTPIPPTPTPPTPTPKIPTPIPPTPSPPSTEKCPIDTLKLGACANVLGGLLGTIIGTPPSSKECCGLIQNLADGEAALCLCTAIKANILGINLNVPVSISLILSACQKEVPNGYKCS